MKALTNPAASKRVPVDVVIVAQLVELIEEETYLKRILRNVASQPLAMQRAVAAAVRNLDAKSAALETALSRS